MSIVLGDNQYGKAENRVVRINRDSDRHTIKDVRVGSSLRGDFALAHTAGDQRRVLPTDTQKQTIYAYAKEFGIDAIEDYGLALARHFVDDVEPVDSARLEIDEYAWERAVVDGTEHDHTWVRSGAEIRTADITVDGVGEDQRTWVLSGLKDLVVLKSTGSEFKDFLVDEYTVLEPTSDRVMATSLQAKWRYIGIDIDWNAVYSGVRSIVVAEFAQVHSLALQQTLYEIGKAVLEAYPEIAEIRLSAPNKHHFVYDLSPFGLENNNEVFHADDRPYGLIQATVLRDDVPAAPAAWIGQLGWLT
ncbi:putative uricase [Gordonia effusa NBRC 100432]|uniref:Uricase n=1 Tax=Gordonia effusa NBRC 100432 TaxID=1077974 RepID=H0R461_9ACTN|nr:urate oxidase [Gordonia effusa]GAB19862.1 putative uricase [Gordonia effusa NBRC 100432]